MKHNKNKGFSLIELVVVIAIMAILIGVAVPVYSAYVDKSAKAADIQMVDEIIHAIQIGAYSDQFAMGDSFKMGNMSYPVGIIVLTPDGTKVITSETAMSSTNLYPETPGACEFVTVDNAKVITTETATATCGLFGGNTYTKHIVTDTSITYCKAHTPEANLANGLIVLEGSDTKDYLTNLECSKTGFHMTHSFTKETNITISNATIADTSYLYTPSASNPSMCKAAYSNQTGIYDENTSFVEAQSGNALYDAITEVFGDDLSLLQLKYDDWADSEGTDYATFYTSADVLMDDLQNFSGLLVSACLINGAEDTLGISKKYTSKEEVLLGFSSNFAKTHTSLDSWMNVWNNVPDNTNGWAGNGFGLTGRENYSAARMAYNTAFSSYLDAKGYSQYSATVKEFFSQELLGVGLPGVICNSAFTDPESPLFEELTTEQVAELHKVYAEYVASDAHSENGKLVYNTVCTFNDTSDTANLYAEKNNASIYDYYNRYVNEIAGLYNKAKEEAGNGIVIIVSIENGVLTFQSSPAEAIPN